MPESTAEQPVTIVLRAAALLEGFDAAGEPILHRDAGLAVIDGRVAAIAPFAELAARHPGAPVIGDADTVVIPGLVNAHHHVGLTPLQLGSPDHPLELWFASRLALRDVDLRLDTLFSAFEMIASGVTTVQHLHSRAPGGPDRVLAAARAVTGAYREIGMRASYSMALRDQNRLVYEDDAAFTARLPEALRPAMRGYFERFTLPLADQVALFDEIRALVAGDPRIAVQIAPANLHWLSDAALEAAADLSARHNLPMHMHLLETPYQKAYATRRTGGSALAWLHRLGLTGPRMTIGHGVWMTEADIELCAHTGTRICHNCSSNMRLKSGTAPVNRFLAAGIPVALGMDEAGINDDRDMLQEMRLALRMHREPGIHAPHPTPAQVLRMATEHGAGTLTWGSYTPLISKLDLDVANAIGMRPDPTQATGIKGFVITDRAPNGSFDPEQVAEATQPWWADWRTPTLRTLTALLGSTAGNKFQFTVTSQLTDVSPGERNGVRIHNAKFDIVKTNIGTTNGNEFQLKMF